MPIEPKYGVEALVRAAPAVARRAAVGRRRRERRRGRVRRAGGRRRSRRPRPRLRYRRDLPQRRPSPHRSRPGGRRRRAVLHHRAERRRGAPGRGQSRQRHALQLLGRASSGRLRMGVQASGSLGAIPTNDGATCVFVSLPADRFRGQVRGDAAAAYLRLLHEVSPAFAARLDECAHVSRRCVASAAIADSSSARPERAGRSSAMPATSRIPLTAHGITDALRDAELLARAAITGTAAAFDEYQAHTAGPVAAALRGDRRARVVSVDQRRRAGAAPRVQPRDVARGEGARRALTAALAGAAGWCPGPVVVRGGRRRRALSRPRGFRARHCSRTRPSRRRRDAWRRRTDRDPRTGVR